MSDSKKSGRKKRKGVRELKRLHCSANYDGRKEVGESGYEGVEGVNILSFDEN